MEEEYAGTQQRMHIIRIKIQKFNRFATSGSNSWVWFLSVSVSEASGKRSGKEYIFVDKNAFIKKVVSIFARDISGISGIFACQICII